MKRIPLTTNHQPLTTIHRPLATISIFGGDEITRSLHYRTPQRREVLLV